MSFIPDNGIAYIRIPKTGSSAIEQAIGTKYNRKKNLCHGHKTASEMVQELLALDRIDELQEFVVVIREPLERLVSALNHLHGHKEGHSLDYAMEHALDPREHTKILFKPQVEFLDHASIYHYIIYQYGYINTTGIYDLVDYLGCGTEYDKVGRVNVSKKRFTLEDVQTHKLYPQLAKLYTLDSLLWNRLMMMDQMGFGPTYLEGVVRRGRLSPRYGTSVQTNKTLTGTRVTP